jgi:hypothetical protein
LPTPRQYDVVRLDGENNPTGTVWRDIRESSLTLRGMDNSGGRRRQGVGVKRRETSRQGESFDALSGAFLGTR